MGLTSSSLPFWVILVVVKVRPKYSHEKIRAILQTCSVNHQGCQELRVERTRRSVGLLLKTDVRQSFYKLERKCLRLLTW
jgi:hypothetical protein